MYNFERVISLQSSGNNQTLLNLIIMDINFSRKAIIEYYRMPNTNGYITSATNECCVSPDWELYRDTLLYRRRIVRQIITCLL